MGALEPHRVSAGIQNYKKGFVFINELQEGQLLLPTLNTVLSGFSMLQMTRFSGNLYIIRTDFQREAEQKQL